MGISAAVADVAAPAVEDIVGSAIGGDLFSVGAADAAVPAFATAADAAAATASGLLGSDSVAAGIAGTGGWANATPASLQAAGITDPTVLEAAANGTLSDATFGSANLDANIAAQALNSGGSYDALAGIGGAAGGGGGGAAADVAAASAPASSGGGSLLGNQSLSELAAQNAQAAGIEAGQTSIYNTAAGAASAAGGSTGLGSLLGTASNVGGIAAGLNALAQLGGGAAKVAGGQQAQQVGKQISALAPQAAPFQPYQSTLAAQLFNLLQNPSTITSTPGYQFQLGQGLQALQASQAAQGRLVSGGALTQAQQWGQQYASSQLQQQENMLANLTGAYQSPASAANTQANLLSGGLGGTLGGAQSTAAGIGNIVSPLSTLYSLYNQSSPDTQVS